MESYRADIDGLRAVAVLLVLFYHIDWEVFKAGFIGVDVFFTISGFLITSILLKDMDNGTFTFLKFYKKRAFRLLPAYLFMLVITLVAFYYVLGPLAYSDFLVSALSSTIFASNFYFFFYHGGYFSTLVTELPLLHTWSLAVEEQFYLLMPLLLLFWIKALKKKIPLVTFGGLLIVGIVVSYYFTNLNKNAAYFLLFARGHELLLGASLAIFLSKQRDHEPKLWFSNLLFFSGIIVIVGVSVILDTTRMFPGLLALIPCLASVAIIYAGINPKCFSRKLLGAKYITQVGLLSYSLYLWHWPVIAGLKYIGVEFSIYVQFGVVVISLLMAIFSYKFVETKFRYSRFAQSNKALLAIYIFPALVLVCLIFYLPTTTSTTNQFIIAEKAHRSKPNKWRKECHSSLIQTEHNCILGEQNRIELDAVLWGDSHANHFAPFVDELMLNKKYRAMDITMGSCPPILFDKNTANFISKKCANKNEKVYELIKSSNVSQVYLAASWYGYTLQGESKSFSEKRMKQVLEGLRSTLELLSKSNKQVIVFDTLARMPKDISSCLLKSIKFGSNAKNPACTFTRNGEQSMLSQLVYELVSNYSNVVFVDINKFICEQEQCKTELNGIPIYRDSNHLNSISSRLLTKLYLSDRILINKENMN